MYLISNKIVFTILNAGICILGDYLVELNHEFQLRKAICDNVTHALVGLCSALLIILDVNLRKFDGIERISLIATCVLISSFIDLDHFVEAKSMKLSRAVSIDRRPFLHNTTIPLTLMIFMIPLYYYSHWYRLNVWLCIIVCAFLSHHSRDATRRGFTVWPIGTTKSLPYPLYITCIMFIPFILNKWLNIITRQHRYQTLDILIV